MPAARLWNRCSCQPFAHATSIPEGTRGLPAGLMPWQGADHAQRMAGARTTDLLIRRIYRASTGRGVAQRCRKMSLRARAIVALRENVWRSPIPFRPENAGLCCCRRVWQRLADEYADTSAPLLRSIESEQPVAQQQQQIQPKDDDKQS